MTLLQKMNQTNGTKPREEWIDYLRGTGIILMIIGHASIWRPVNKWILGFHMPLFFMLSGFLFNRQKWAEKGFGKFTAARFKNYIIPYFLWCGICFIINLPMLYLDHRHDSILLAAIQNLGWILTSISVDGLFRPLNGTALWFLTCLFLSQLILYLLVNCRPLWRCVLVGVFIAISYAMNYFKTPVLPWHMDVSLIGSVFMLIGYYIKEKRLLDKVRTAMVPVLMIIISSVIIMWNDKIDMFFRQYGKDVLLFIIQAALMCFSFMWICRSMHSFHLKNLFCNLGRYSIIVMGLNVAVNSYARRLYNSIGSRAGINLHWVEYPLLLISIVFYYLVILLYQKLVSKNSRFSILIGK